VSVGEVVDGHAGALPYDDGAFELVFISVVLIHVPEVSLRQAYEELYRIFTLTARMAADLASLGDEWRPSM
jgi:ubiquinone/menaquinone biosynthesis C-methylase UbiE